MKYILIFIIVVSMAICSVAFIAGASDTTVESNKTPRVYPIAAGIWYPTDGPLPEKPMRYYRVRCFPGCHVGSKYGAFPDTPLAGDHPIFKTSTIHHVTGTAAVKE